MARVIVIGGGAAGLTAARAMSAAGGKVTLLTGSIGGGSSPWAQGGIAVALGQDDNPALHYADTIACGGGINDETTTRTLVWDARARVEELVQSGVPFDRNAKGLMLGLEGGHSRRRIIHAGGGATGWHVIETLAERVREDSNITIIEGVTAHSLITDVFGVRGVRYFAWTDPKSLITLEGPVILATGGCAGLFGRSTNPESVNGSGIALAWQAGAALADMEFVQFHPTALDLPAPELGGRALLLTEALRGEGAHLLNKDGQRFLLEGPLAHPLAELAPRDEVARAIHKERRSGPVYLSLRHTDAEDIRSRFPNLVRLLLPLGLDLATDLLPVAPAAHYLMGGILSDNDGATSIKNLYVAGEAACTGVQGANRLASNSLLECLVFGHRAGLAAMEGKATTLLDRLEASHELTYELPVGDHAPENLGDWLNTHLGVERDSAGIIDVLAVLPESGASTVARRIAEGAWLRRESRGGHFRLDHQAINPRFQGRIIQQRGEAARFSPVTVSAWVGGAR